jgi:hypothetical protein
VVLPTFVHAARAFDQLTDLALADLFRVAVATESCVYSALVSLPSGTAAAAEAEMLMAATAQAAVSRVRSRFAWRTRPSVRHRQPYSGHSHVNLTDFLCAAVGSGRRPRPMQRLASRRCPRRRCVNAGA